MILVRNTFQLKFGKAKDVKGMMKEGVAIVQSAGITENRVCLDVTGPFYTLVLENTFDNLGAFEAALGKMMQDEKWKAWYSSFSQFVESGHREIYSIIA